MLPKKVNDYEFNPPPTEEEERFYSSPQPAIPSSTNPFFPFIPFQMTFLVTVTKPVEAESEDSLVSKLMEELEGGTLEDATVEVGEALPEEDASEESSSETESENSDPGVKAAESSGDSNGSNDSESKEE